MESSIFKIVFLLTVMSSWSTNTFSRESEKVDIRPVRIQIVDADTSKPIEKIQVYYLVDAYKVKKKFLFIFPRIESRGDSRFLVKDKKFSDSNGEIYFHATNIAIKRNEIIEHELLYINIDLDENHWYVSSVLSSQESKQDYWDLLEHELLTYSSESDYFIRPNSSYKGFYILSANWREGDFICGNPDWDIIDYKCISNGLTKEKDEITVKLQRISEQEIIK